MSVLGCSEQLHLNIPKPGNSILVLGENNTWICICKQSSSALSSAQGRLSGAGSTEGSSSIARGERRTKEETQSIRERWARNWRWKSEQCPSWQGHHHTPPNKKTILALGTKSATSYLKVHQGKRQVWSQVSQERSRREPATKPSKQQGSGRRPHWNAAPLVPAGGFGRGSWWMFPILALFMAAWAKVLQLCHIRGVSPTSPAGL